MPGALSCSTALSDRAGFGNALHCLPTPPLWTSSTIPSPPCQSAPPLADRPWHPDLRTCRKITNLTGSASRQPSSRLLTSHIFLTRGRPVFAAPTIWYHSRPRTLRRKPERSATDSPLLFPFPSTNAPTTQLSATVSIGNSLSSPTGPGSTH